ncbi:MAG: hypothetical protein KAT28_00645 [Candidatus Aenigmarchaeota archaeon]|nr:hypothetical protein [Candidatus Aenigmarchaeota archaeon]
MVRKKKNLYKMLCYIKTKVCRKFPLFCKSFWFLLAVILFLLALGLIIFFYQRVLEPDTAFKLITNPIECHSNLNGIFVPVPCINVSATCYPEYEYFMEGQKMICILELSIINQTLVDSNCKRIYVTYYTYKIDNYIVNGIKSNNFSPPDTPINISKIDLSKKVIKLKPFPTQELFEGQNGINILVKCDSKLDSWQWGNIRAKSAMEVQQQKNLVLSLVITALFALFGIFPAIKCLRDLKRNN